MSAPVSHDGTGFDSDDEMMQAYADESPAADFLAPVRALVATAYAEPSDAAEAPIRLTPYPPRLWVRGVPT